VTARGRGRAPRPRGRLARAAGLLACGPLLAGCGIGALAPNAEMPAEQWAGIVAQRVALAPMTAGGSEVAVFLAAREIDRREAALQAPGGLGAAVDWPTAEASYQDQVRPALDLDDPFTRFLLAARLWLAGEVDAGRIAQAQAREALAQIRLEVWRLRARRENFAPAAVHLRRTLWAATPGITLESLQREGELYRRFRLGCPTERAWGNVHTIC